MLVNVALVAFNLLPAFPMDGGRALRALLAMRIDYARATHLAATIGQAWPWCSHSSACSAIRCCSSSHCSSGLARLRNRPRPDEGRARRNPRAPGDADPLRSLTRTSTLSDDASLLLTGSQQDFPVVEDGRVAGMLDTGGSGGRHRAARAGHRGGNRNAAPGRRRGRRRHARIRPRPTEGMSLPHPAGHVARPARRPRDSRKRGRVPDDPGGGTEGRGEFAQLVLSSGVRRRRRAGHRGPHVQGSGPRVAHHGFGFDDARLYFLQHTAQIVERGVLSASIRCRCARRRSAPGQERRCAPA